MLVTHTVVTMNCKMSGRDDALKGHPDFFQRPKLPLPLLLLVEVLRKLMKFNIIKVIKDFLSDYMEYYIISKSSEKIFNVFISGFLLIVMAIKELRRWWKPLLPRSPRNPAPWSLSLGQSSHQQ
ncbi:hypothetical protein CHARACLAT_025303 [Characodon lateralis]|uniref:Uncharacterized protein n=1 Tax=Characodon lateralis TaxID=208331 RepID=A0ABU7EWY3_9TELE|nr:hypothetical protein [Characodon lateralis]